MECHSIVEPRDFGAPTGRGMAALQPIKRGDIVLSVSLKDVVTPKRCRALLLKRIQRFMGASSACAADPFPSAKEFLAAKPEYVQPLDDWKTVRSACRAAGIDPENDSQREAVLGRALQYVDFDPSDDTCECRELGEEGDETIWFPVSALCPASSSSFLAAISDENILVVALLVAKHGDITDDEYACCPGLRRAIADMPEAVGLCAEWEKEDFEGMRGSQHYESAATLRDDVKKSRSKVQKAVDQLMSGASEDERAQLYGSSLDAFVWGWVRVASRHRSRAAFPSLSPDEGKTVMIEGGFGTFNHSVSLPHGCSLKETHDSTMLSVIAQEDYDTGDQVFISYGAKGSHELLIGYGFCVPNNPDDCYQLILGLDKFSQSTQSGTSRTRVELALQLLAKGEADESVVRHNGRNAGTTEVRVLLRRGDVNRVLPPAFLGLSRLEKLSDDDIVALEKFFGKDKLLQRLFSTSLTEDLGPSSSKSEQLACNALLLRADVLVFGGLNAHFKAVLGQLSDWKCLPAPCGDKVDTRTIRHYLGSLVVKGERDVLQSAVKLLSEGLEAILRRALELVLSLSRIGDGSTVPKAQQSLRDYLKDSSARVAAGRDRAVELYTNIERLGIFDLQGAEDTLTWATMCNFLFLSAYGAFIPQLADGNKDIAPVLTIPNNAGVFRKVWPVLKAGRVAKFSDTSATPVIDAYVQKTSFWGKYLLSEFLSTGAFSQGAMNDMAQESIDIRKNSAWSVPTSEAMEVLRSVPQPILEIGAGRGLWAEAIAKHGNIQWAAYELGAWDERYASDGSTAAGVDDGFSTNGAAQNCLVKNGGPDNIRADTASRSLALMWPDYEGKGSFALECLRHWLERDVSECLVTVGEWGAVSADELPLLPGLPPRGQSFSPEAQTLVEAEFVLDKEVALPNWPLTRDKLRVWKRRTHCN
eukprot:TRINITY_DN26264_c0_g1_i1.p1 TRINITY_DN26264_c0_g1~~TRINITY_DN26264_c0_g1_i1.p1  ORF type:complete len:948 (-),score=139.14 TRINITY_DN26264_c0_g1_i1:117-2900(-)